MNFSTGHTSQFMPYHFVRPFRCSCGSDASHNLKIDDKVAVVAIAALAALAATLAGGYIIGAGAALLTFYLASALLKSRNVSYVKHYSNPPPRMFFFRPAFYGVHIARTSGSRWRLGLNPSRDRRTNNFVSPTPVNFGQRPSFSGSDPSLRQVPGTNTLLSSNDPVNFVQRPGSSGANPAVRPVLRGHSAHTGNNTHVNPRSDGNRQRAGFGNNAPTMLRK